MKKFTTIVFIFLVCISLVLAAPRPQVGEVGWGDILNEYLNVSLDEEGSIRNGVITNDMLNLTNISVDEVVTGAVHSDTVDGTVHIQKDVDSSGRVRFFRDTVGNPMFNLWGYDSEDGVQKYITIAVFDNPAFSEAGASSRAIISSGGNVAGARNALELQSPDQVRITAVDDVLNQGLVRIAADVGIQFHPRTAAETDSAKYIFFDTEGGSDSADPTIETNSGDLIISPKGDLRITAGGYADASATVHLQQNADSSGRVRFFRDTVGNPMFNLWGYDSEDGVQKYITIAVFDNPAFSEAGASSRAIISSGGNVAGARNALELQSPDQVRITAVDDVLNQGLVRIAADTTIQFHTRTNAETDSAKYIFFDTEGSVQGDDASIDTNSGDLVLNPAGSVRVKTGGASNQVVCWKADAETLGYCSDAPNGSGVCTCV